MSKNSDDVKISDDDMMELVTAVEMRKLELGFDHDLILITVKSYDYDEQGHPQYYNTKMCSSLSPHEVIEVLQGWVEENQPPKRRNVKIIPTKKEPLN